MFKLNRSECIKNKLNTMGKEEAEEVNVDFLHIQKTN